MCVRHPWSLSEALPKSVASPGLSEARRYRCRFVTLRLATQELCRLQRLAQQTFFGTPEAAARVEWAMPVGKPHCSLASHLTRLQPSAPLSILPTLPTPLPPAASRCHLLLSPPCRRCPQAYANTPLPPAVAAALRPPDGLGCTWSRGPALPRGSPHACGRPPPLQKPARLLRAAFRPREQRPRRAGLRRGWGVFLRSRTCVGADTHRYDPQAPTWLFRPPRFVAWELALMQVTEPTAEGATLWKKLASVSLAPP